MSTEVLKSLASAKHGSLLLNVQEELIPYAVGTGADSFVVALLPEPRCLLGALWMRVKQSEQSRSECRY